MKHIEKLLPEANRLLVESNEIIDIKEWKVKDKGVYESYLASFGPNVVMAGLLPTLMTYEADIQKKRIADLIKKLGGGVTNDELLNCADSRKTMYYWKEKLVDASIALKIMIRTFKIDKDKE